MGAHYAFGCDVDEGEAGGLSVPGEGGAAGVKDMDIVGILIEALMGMGKEGDGGIDLLGL